MRFPCLGRERVLAPVDMDFSGIIVDVSIVRVEEGDRPAEAVLSTAKQIRDET